MTTMFVSCNLDYEDGELPGEPLIPIGSPVRLIYADEHDALISYYGLEVVVAKDLLSPVPLPGTPPAPPPAEALAHVVQQAGGLW